MRMILGTVLIASAISGPAATRQRPDFSGSWTLPPDAPLAPNGKPAAAPGFGPTINIRHAGDTITISRLMSGSPVHVVHRLDGSETRSAVSGRLCVGETESRWTAAWDGDAILTTLVGSRSAGAPTVTKMDVRTRFRLEEADSMSVEVTFQNPGMSEPRTVSTRYRRSGAAAEIPPPAPPPAVTASIGALAWLAGTWIGTEDATTFEERWTPPAGGAMLAIARTIRNGASNAFEFLCIVERNGGLVYQAMPNGRQPATDFALTTLDAGSATFENPAHDFPKKVRYALAADGTLEAMISGTDRQKPRTFRFRRQ